MQPYGYGNYNQRQGSIPPSAGAAAAHEQGESPAFEDAEGDELNEEGEDGGALRAIILQMLQRQAQGGR